MRKEKKKEIDRKRRLYDSRDEMNMIEIPFALLSDRAPGGVNVIERSWDAFDFELRQEVQRKVTVIGDGKFGLPTAKDEQVYEGLLHAGKEENELRDRHVFFSRGALLETIGWKRENRDYKRLTLAMDRLAGTRLICENLWRDNEKKQTRVRENVSILDSYKFRDTRLHGEGFRESRSEFTWGASLFESFQAGYLKRLDLGIIFDLSTLAGRLGRLLDKIAHPEKGRTRFDFDVRELLCERMGASQKSELSHLIKRQLLPACRELEEIRFLKKIPADTRVTQVRRGKATVHFEVIGNLSGKKSSLRIPASINSGATRPERRIFSAGRFK